MELNIPEIQKYFLHIMNNFPTKMESLEITMNNIAYFCINGIAITGGIGTVINEELRLKLIEWLYSHQVQAPLYGGFRHSACHFTPSHTIQETHIAMTYSSLASLLILGDDLKRVEVPRVMEMLKSLQLPDGSFLSHHLGSESDLRFVFSACAICRMLQTFGDLDMDKTIDYILSCQTYEGGFAWSKESGEAHGAATYCAIASLSLLGALDKLKNKRLLAYWLSQRQEDGFNGRAHKLMDTCYSFWVGAPIKALGWFDDIVDKDQLTNFIFSNYCSPNQFRPNQNGDPDIVHTHFSLVGLSFCGYHGLEEVDPVFGFVKKYIPEDIQNHIPEWKHSKPQ